MYIYIFVVRYAYSIVYMWLYFFNIGLEQLFVICVKWSGFIFARQNVCPHFALYIYIFIITCKLFSSFCSNDAPSKTKSDIWRTLWKLLLFKTKTRPLFGRRFFEMTKICDNLTKFPGTFPTADGRTVCLSSLGENQRTRGLILLYVYWKSTHSMEFLQKKMNTKKKAKYKI